MIQPGENTERFTLRFAEEFRKQIAKGGGLKRASSYDVVLGREGSWKKGGEGSSRGKSNIDRWVFSRTPTFVSKTGPLKSPKGGGGDWDDESHSWRGLTSVKEKLYCLNLKVEQGEKGSSPRPSI
ncbi:E3 ubiquitin-protein ligase ATL6 [Gossypium australe]|uniref:E3 ubiquitin-protein ligase ATL6 n=1 Tax=Gossypium australe TaxID=47621 RepID=A0A5B6UY20_9ROSI|nr:E3 ubiquitin-protein ligase ATL6 [Gossypium australe]